MCTAQPLRLPPVARASPPGGASANRAAPKSEVDAIRLENLWRDQLDARGWSRAASNCLRLSLASSTLSNYDRYIRDLFVFCDARGLPFPPRDTAAMADFFMHRCCSSARPHSTVHCVSAAVSALYEALGMDNPARDPFIVRLLQSIVKSGTRAPLAKSTVMDVSAFSRLFRSWPANEDLTIKQLRCKTIALLALALMLRPSDIAPLARRYDAGTDIVSDFVMSTDQFQFTEDGAVKVTFLGVKNDTQRTGFQVTLPPSTDPKLDPVGALRTYLSLTDSVRCRITKPAFLTLVRPFVAVSRLRCLASYRKPSVTPKSSGWGADTDRKISGRQVQRARCSWASLLTTFSAWGAGKPVLFSWSTMCTPRWTLRLHKRCSSDSRLSMLCDTLDVFFFFCSSVLCLEHLSL